MKDLKAAILKGERRALGKAITLIESGRADHQQEAQKLLGALLPHTGKSIRLGITGTPGVGKSTFIEVFGKFLTAQNLKVAVLTVDPSSRISGGSILGDKTRMEELAKDENAFIRPSPSGGSLGGVARRTREAMLILEAAGYDVVLVETVGVGQSEVAVADMVDMFLLLLAPGGGDELQGIKRGIMELADLVIVNKADGDFEKAAALAAAQYKSALHLMRPKSANWTAKVLLASALNKKGIEDIWQEIGAFRDALDASGEIKDARAMQAVSWMWSEIHDGVSVAFEDDHATDIKAMETAVQAGKIPPTKAARALLGKFLGK